MKGSPDLRREVSLLTRLKCGEYRGDGVFFEVDQPMVRQAHHERLEDTPDWFDRLTMSGWKRRQIGSTGSP